MWVHYIKLESYNLQFIKDCIDDGIFSDMTLLNYIIIQSNKEWNPRAGILANFLRNTYQSNIELTQVLAAPGMTLPNNREIIKPVLIKIDYDQNANLIHILDDNFSRKLLTSVIFFYNEILSLDPNLTFRGDLFSSYLYNGIMIKDVADKTILLGEFDSEPISLTDNQDIITEAIVDKYVVSIIAKK